MKSGMIHDTWTNMIKVNASIILLTSFVVLLPGQAIGDPEIIRPKVVVVTMFELGEDTGDAPGEFQLCIERVPLDTVIPFPQDYRELRYNEEKGILGMVTGIGTFKSAASVMALGMDSRFDLRESLWLVPPD